MPRGVACAVLSAWVSAEDSGHYMAGGAPALQRLGRAKIGRLEIGELIVGSLRVTDSLETP